MKEHYKGIGHIAIYTVDMDQSIAFYEMIGGSVFKRDGVETPEGLKKLALVEFGGFLLELIEPPAGTLLLIPPACNVYRVRGGETRALLCGSDEAFAQKNGTRCLYPGQIVAL